MPPGATFWGCGGGLGAGAPALAPMLLGVVTKDWQKTMKRSNSIPNDNVIPFPGPERNRWAACTRAGGALDGDERGDHGPSPEESLRLMRAFVGIKNRQLRADLITMLEGASRTRGRAPVRGNE
jgi:hypothetical protein